MVGLVDKAGNPVSGASILLLADPAGLPAEARGSWLHHRAFRQRAVTSSLGNVRFTGVPPGRIIVRAKTAAAALEHRGTAVSDEELQVSFGAAMTRPTGNYDRLLKKAADGGLAFLLLLAGLPTTTAAQSCQGWNTAKFSSPPRWGR